MSVRIFFLFIFILLGEYSYSQYYPNYDIPVFAGSKELSLAWTGGLNNPQLSAADLNNDGVQDLVIFDRTGEKFLTFINNNITDSVSYTYASKYELNFPKIFDWALLLDFNCDNIADLFAHNGPGVAVYKGFYNNNNQLCFSLYSNLLMCKSFNGSTNVYVSGVDIPAIVDIDNDGDIDIGTFEITGGSIDYYKNLSDENGHGCDSLSFVIAENCWGKMFEPSNTPLKVLNKDCPFRLEEGASGLSSPKTRHSGSTLLMFDNDGDGDKELVVGDIGFNDLVYLQNGGDSLNALITSQDIYFPEYSFPVNLPNFPAAFYLDLNNDELKDFVASPNSEYGSENIGNVWFYKNIGKNDSGRFIFQTDSLFTNDMIEVGEGAAPVFVDLNNDGLFDMIVANRNYYNSYSSLAYFQNTGTVTEPQFKLITRDYMNLSSFHLFGFYPSFGDLDDDNDLDMILGTEDGTLLYYKNIASPGSAADFALIDPLYPSGFSINDTIDVGSYSTPQIVDVNKDGLLDLLIGNESGTIYYYQNKGTPSSPDHTDLTNDFFGGVNVQQEFSITGYSVPFLTRLNGSVNYSLLVGCEGGTIFKYDNIDGNLNGSFTKTDTVYARINVGSLSTISGADINNDGVPELVIGNYRGGVSLYDTLSAHSIYSLTIHAGSLSAKIFPNPSNGIFHLKLAGSEEIINPAFSITNLLGQNLTCAIRNIGSNEYLIDASGFPSGIYFCKVLFNKSEVVIKLVVNK